jgi:hypothetical protein
MCRECPASKLLSVPRAKREKLLRTRGHRLRFDLRFQFRRTLQRQSAQVAPDQMAAAQRNHRNEEQREPPFRFHRREHGRPRALRAGILHLPDGLGLRAYSEEKKHTDLIFLGSRDEL